MGYWFTEDTISWLRTKDTTILVRNHEIRAYKKELPSKDLEKSGFGEDNRLLKRINSDHLYDSRLNNRPAWNN